MKFLTPTALIIALPFITAIITVVLVCATFISPLIIFFLLYVKHHDKKYKIYKEFFQKMSKIK